MKLSKIDKLFGSLVVNRKDLTSKEIKTKFKLKNPYDAISSLRKEGYDIPMKNKKYVYRGLLKAGF